MKRFSDLGNLFLHQEFEDLIIMRTKNYFYEKAHELTNK